MKCLAGSHPDSLFPEHGVAHSSAAVEPDPRGGRAQRRRQRRHHLHVQARRVGLPKAAGQRHGPRGPRARSRSRAARRRPEADGGVQLVVEAGDGFVQRLAARRMPQRGLFGLSDLAQLQALRPQHIASHVTNLMTNCWSTRRRRRNHVEIFEFSTKLLTSFKLRRVFSREKCHFWEVKNFTPF